jgi:hypothetical protein
MTNETNDTATQNLPKKCILIAPQACGNERLYAKTILGIFQQMFSGHTWVDLPLELFNKSDNTVNPREIQTLKNVDVTIVIGAIHYFTDGRYYITQNLTDWMEILCPKAKRIILTEITHQEILHKFCNKEKSYFAHDINSDFGNCRELLQKILNQ